MSQTVYIVYKEKSKVIADKIAESIFYNNKFILGDDGITDSDILKMAKLSTTEYFYVIRSTKDIDISEYNFSYVPPEWDKEFVHVWKNNIQVSLYNKKLVLQSPTKFTDKEISNGNLKLKNIDETIFKDVVYDIVFLNYDEVTADKNFEILKKRFPRAIKSSKVKGIYNAHRAAARLVKTNMFYVVDADAEILESFNFDYKIDEYNIDTVHVWNSINPINGLIYGYGGVKLFPTQMLLDYSGSPVDFTTSVSSSFKLIDSISNITKFNVDPFSTWRSAFRECTKLSSKLIANQVDLETEERLNIWKTVGIDKEFGKFAIEGAKAGSEYGLKNKDNKDALELINDYDWLKLQFSNQQ